MPEHKRAVGLKITDEDKGEVSAVFARFNVVDLDGDVTLPGAFTDGQQVRISSWNHDSWAGALPVGKGAIRRTDTEAIMDGRFFLDTVAGAETFTVVKELGALGEWSYGYDIKEQSFGEFEDEDVRFLRRLEVHEVSPVLLGAGIDTRTLVAKSRKQKLADHIDAVLTDVDALAKRTAEVMAMRRENGKTLGEHTSDRLSRLDASLKRLREVLTSAPSTQLPPDMARELARYERRRATL